MKPKKLFLFSILILSLVLPCCGSDEGDEERDCPKFRDYQILPQDGGPLTEYELLVIMSKSEENHRIATVKGVLYNSDGSSAQVSLDLVQSNADPYRFVRRFKGNEVCEEGTCMLYFKVVATHQNACMRTFNTDVFAVEISQSPDDDDDDDDTGDDDDSANDDDAADDDDNDDAA